MTKQVINLGAAPSGAGGDDRRSAWLKAIANFDELYDTAAKAYLKSNILGTVSQAGGVPTGAIFERGSNANGEYVKYADGTMICRLDISVTDQAINNAYAGGVYQGTRAWAFPAAFSGSPVVVPGAFRWGSSASWSAIGGSASATTATLRGLDMVSRSSGTATQISAIAIGRWF